MVPLVRPLGGVFSALSVGSETCGWLGLAAASYSRELKHGQNVCGVGVGAAGALVLGGRGPYLHVLGSHHHPGVLWKTPHGGPWVRGAGGGAIARGSVGALLWDTRVMWGAMYSSGYGELEAKLALGAEQEEPQKRRRWQKSHKRRRRPRALPGIARRVARRGGRRLREGGCLRRWEAPRAAPGSQVLGGSRGSPLCCKDRLPGALRSSGSPGIAGAAPQPPLGSQGSQAGRRAGSPPGDPLPVGSWVGSFLRGPCLGIGGSEPAEGTHN